MSSSILANDKTISQHTAVPCPRRGTAVYGPGHKRKAMAGGAQGFKTIWFGLYLAPHLHGSSATAHYFPQGPDAPLHLRRKRGAKADADIIGEAAVRAKNLARSDADVVP